jgi:hypothetical protein
MNNGRGKTIICQQCRAPYYVTPIEVRFHNEIDIPVSQLCRPCKRRAEEKRAQGTVSPTLLAANNRRQ